MERTAKLNNKGISLIEVLIAMVVALVVFLALMQTALVGIDTNMRNILREEAVNIAEATMSAARDIAFDTLASSTSTVRKKIRNIKDPTTPSLDFPFTTTTTVTNSAGGDNKMVTIVVGWSWKGENFTHSISTVRKR